MIRALTLGLIMASGGLLAACAADPPKPYLTSEYQDDKTCRSFMKNKSHKDDTTYEECRQSLVDFANMPPMAPAQPNVTVIINH